MARNVKNPTVRRDNRADPSPLADEMIARYVEWREDATAVAESYRRWTMAAAGEANMRYVAYLAALHEEAASADLYAQAVAEVSRCVSADSMPDAS